MNELPPFGLRKAFESDAEQLSALIVGAFSSYRVQLDPPSSAPNETPEAVRVKLATHGAAIAESAGIGIGCVLFTQQEPETLYVGRLAVEAAWRGRGVARALMAFAEAEARNGGLRILQVKVRIPLADNQRFFKCCGFAEVGRESHAGYSAPTMIRMEKRLT